jgi:thiamine biosynthesis lipoprotein
MGSPCELQLDRAPRSRAAVAVPLGAADAATDRTSDEAVLAAAIAEVERLEARYSRYRETSFLSEMNRVAAVGGEITVDPETAGLLDYAATCHAESGGLFDVTSGILRRAWRFKEKRLPAPGEVEALLEHVGFEKLDWRAPVLSFPIPGLELDFGGIVKEYAADRVAALLRQAGRPHALVNLGGDIRVAGPRADGRAWRIGIRHPRRPGAMLRTIELSSGALSTSGDYERCIELGGVRYGHVLDPRTGWPVRFMASASVVGPLCVVAGSASTIALLKGEAGPDWLAQLGLPCLWVDVDGRTGGSLAPA